jgi:GH25 family lysozyme M1 (1,4-beta-N-acetylmuramidase)
MSIQEPTWLIDVSEHQGPNVNFSEVKSEGYSGAIAKMTEGTGYVDPYGVSNLGRIISSDLLPGAYHFLWGGMSARNQALHFLRQVSKVTDPARVMLFVDVEISGNMNVTQHPTLLDVQRFLKTLEEKVPSARLGIYSGYYWRSNMGNPRISSLGLKGRPIIWDAHYFSTDVNWGSVLYGSVPESYWDKPAFGGLKADILQFASTGRLVQFPNGIDVNACPEGLDALQPTEDSDMGNWHPGHGDSLTPPGFKPKRRVIGSPNYVLDHPTRYRWQRHIEPLIRRLYRELGGPPEIHINTYVFHPPYDPPDITRRHDTLSFDVWGSGGRGRPIGASRGQTAFDLIWNDPGLPWIDWIIWNRTIRWRGDGFTPRPFGEGPFSWHEDHVHCTFLPRGR